jgi:hypothetical protein
MSLFKKLNGTPASRNGRRMKKTGYLVRLKLPIKNIFFKLFNICFKMLRPELVMIRQYIIQIFFSMALRPNGSHGLLILEVSR